MNKFSKGGLAAGALIYALLIIGFWAAVIAVAVHFITKAW